MNRTRHERESFLDVVRVVALGRVIVWHAFGAAAITYVVSAVPAMFFVTGSLLAKSLDRRPARQVLFERLRRILVPLWVFGAVAYAAMAVADHVDPGPGTTIPWGSIGNWLLPLGDPKGNGWEGGWMAQPLWYLRTLVWLLALSPFLRHAVRRSAGATFAALAVAVFALDLVGRRPDLVLHAAPQLWWQIGDVALYAIFLLLGFCHRDGRLDRLGRAEWLGVTVASASVGALWCLTQPVPGNVVNNSHPAHLFVGAAWLAAAMAFRDPIATLATRRATASIVAFATRRSMSIYLWHTTAIVLTYRFLATRGAFAPGVFTVMVLAGTLAGTVAFVLLFGWVEDVAARRAPRLWPLERRDPVRPVPGFRWTSAAFVLVAVGLVVLSATDPRLPAATASARTVLPPVPSKAPPVPVFTPTTATGSTTGAASDDGATDESTEDGEPVAAARLAPTPPVLTTLTEQRLQAAIDLWRRQVGVAGVQVGVSALDGFEWAGAVGTQADGRPVGPEDRFVTASITKTFTGALVMQEVTAGRISLDAPLPPLTRVPTFPYTSRLTVRELLTHRSGLAQYRSTPEYQRNPAAMDSPEKAVTAVGRMPLDFTPGTETAYSTTNYLLLGFLLEQVTGRSYDELLTSRLLLPVGLNDTSHAAPTPGEPNGGTSGIGSSTRDLLRWARALYLDGNVVDPLSLAYLLDVDPATGIGPATEGYCPCRIDLDGRRHWFGVGHSSGLVSMVAVPDEDLVITIAMTTPLDDSVRNDAEEQLRSLLVAIVDASPSTLSDAG